MIHNSTKHSAQRASERYYKQARHEKVGQSNRVSGAKMQPTGRLAMAKCSNHRPGQLNFICTPGGKESSSPRKAAAFQQWIPFLVGSG
ncbi:hypothetical protein GJ744_005618 [Endocarpon pusillum]|uniref:Uncharacterized protein n=1 Tax=Endocarpon pusillum TaxID=364733 RepID=A0A8H7A8L6_9EURO|nr:hypothetical protein GJ744_005618 [Endocarpon pusillum]